MSTRAFASAVIRVPIDQVWKAIREFDFPSKLLKTTIKSVVIEDHVSPTTVGAVRKVTWQNNEWRRQRLIELSDQYHKITWESIEAEPALETSAVITTVRLHRISEDNSTLVEWSSDFSSDVKGDFVKFEQKSYLENLKEIRNTLQKN